MKRPPAPARVALIVIAATPLLALGPASTHPQADGRTRPSISDVRSGPGPAPGRHQGAGGVGDVDVTRTASAHRSTYGEASGRFPHALDGASVVSVSGRTPGTRRSAGDFDSTGWLLLTGPLALGLSCVVWSLRPRRSPAHPGSPVLPRRAARTGHDRTRRSGTSAPVVSHALRA